jgi:hypothetical protein
LVQSIYPCVSIFHLHSFLPSPFCPVGHALDPFKRNYLGFRFGTDKVNCCFKIMFNPYFHLGPTLSNSLSFVFAFYFLIDKSSVSSVFILSILFCTSVTSCVLTLKDLFSTVYFLWLKAILI